MRDFSFLIGAILLAGTVLTVALLINVGQPLLLKSGLYPSGPTVTTSPKPGTTPSPSATLTPTASPKNHDKICKCSCFNYEGSLPEKMCKVPWKDGTCTNPDYWFIPQEDDKGKIHCDHLTRYPDQPGATQNCSGYRKADNKEPNNPNGYLTCLLREPDDSITIKCVGNCIDFTSVEDKPLCKVQWVDGKCSNENLTYIFNPMGNDFTCRGVDRAATCTGYRREDNQFIDRDATAGDTKPTIIE